MKLICSILMVLTIARMMAVEIDYSEKITRKSDFSELVDTVFFKFPIFDTDMNIVSSDDLLFTKDGAILLCVTSVYTCSSCNSGLLSILNSYTEKDSLSTCLLIEDYFHKETKNKIGAIKSLLVHNTRILFDADGRNTEILKKNNSNCNFWLVVMRRNRIIHVEGFADYQRDIDLVKKSIKNIEKEMGN